MRETNGWVNINVSFYNPSAIGLYQWKSGWIQQMFSQFPPFFLVCLGMDVVDWSICGSVLEHMKQMHNLVVGY